MTPTMFVSEMSADTKPANILPEFRNKEWADHHAALKDLNEWAKKDGLCLHSEKSQISGKKKYLIVTCKHYGEPRNQEERAGEATGPAMFLASNDGKITSSTEKPKERKKHSERLGCKFKINLRPYASSCPAKSTIWRITSMTENKHMGHGNKSSIASYPMHRRLDKEQLDNGLRMISHGMQNTAIAGILSESGYPCIAKAIANIRQKMYNNDPERAMFHLITSFGDDDYDVRFSEERQGDNAYLKTLFFAHENAISLAREFPDVISMDATYKTNRKRMPFINVVGVSNAGYQSLKTFNIAGGSLSNEDTESYTWFVKALKEVVWPDMQEASPRVIITDNEAALMNALDGIFPQAAKILCQVHLRPNFRTKIKKFFTLETDYETFEKALNFLMASKLE